jgi:hypothetical protein
MSVIVDVILYGLPEASWLAIYLVFRDGFLGKFSRCEEFSEVRLE